MFCFRAPQTDLSYYLLLTMKLMFITFGLFPISSKTTQQNSLQLILKNYSILLFNNTSCIQNLTTNPYELANCNEQIIKFLNSTSLGSTACSTCTNNFVCITPANYSILEQIGSYCEQTVINTTYFQISQEKLDQIIKSMDSYGKKLISPDTKKYLGDSVYSPFHIICTICTRNYSMMDKLLKVTNLMNKSNCTDNYHDCEIPLPLLQYKNVLFLCVNCSQNNTITVVQTINSTFSFTQLFDIVMQTSLEVENEFHQLFTPPSVNVTSFCSVDNVALNEGEQNNYTLIRKNASSAYTQIHSKAEQIKLSRRKRNSEPNTNDIYSTMHSHLLPPRNLQIVPLSFGSLNISWIPAKVNEQFITHYELILFSLNEKSDSLYDHCFRTHTRYNHTGHHVYLAPFSSQNRQVFINVTAPADYAVITGLPPDNFYRVLLFAVGNSLRSPPATMPSSPRVPALSPQTPPDGIKITPRGTQSAKISWNPPSDVECMGELMNYVININSSRLIEPIIIKVPQSKRSHIVENLIPGTFYTVQVSATTRGGLGVPSKSVHFQTGGELPKLDPDELEGIEISKSNLESNMGSLNVDFFEEETKVDELVDSVKQPGTSPLYVLPSRIHNLRATPTQTSITLKWSIALRQINMDSETHLYDNVDYEYTSMVNPRHLIPVSMKNEKYDKDTTGLLPPGTKYIIRWGDMHPGPSEDSVRGDQTHYTIENLRPGTIYYIRVISVTEGGDGPAAYTVVMTQDSSAATKPTNRGLLIPVNLVVLQLGSTWARVGWDIPHIPQSLKLSISGFQVKYYSVKSSLEQEEYDGRQESEMEMTNSITEQFTTKKVEDKKYELKMINMTLLPNQILAEHFDIVLRDLKPATQYEFGVRMLHSEVLSEESNADNDDRTVKTYFWSMVQGFETFGKSPKDAPKNIRLSKLRLNNKLQTKLQLLDFTSIQTSSIIHRDEIHDQNDNNNNNPSAHFLVTMYIKWDPPNYPNGKILASAVYLTTNTKQSTRKWMERSVNGGSTEAGLRLQPSTLYFVKVNSRNQHGRSPSSNIIAFYAPNADGSGGGIIQFTKDYYNLNEIHETFDRIQPFPNENELNNFLTITTTTTITNNDNQNNTNKKLIEIENFHWIILGSVLGCALVIMMIITLALLSRCRKTKLASTLTKRNSSIGSNKSYSHCCQREGRNLHELECLQKNTSFNVNDICLNANLLSSCSPSETLAAGSNSGSVGVRTGHSITNDPFNQNIRMNVYPSHNPACMHSECNVKKTNETAPLLASNHCNCGAQIIDTSTPSPPINWMPNVGAFNIIGVSSGSGGGGRCFEDRHSTSAESDNDINNNSMKLINNGLENGRSWRNDMNCGKIKLNKQWSANSHDLNGELMNANINASHEMTLSYLASNVQNPINCHASYCQQQQQLKNMGNQSPFKSSSVINPSHIHMTCCTNTNTNNPHSNFNRSRDYRNNQLTKMIGDHVCTGSGSLTDDVTASSPGSSATGRTQSYLNHISSSPTNTSLNLKKYNRIIGKYEDEDENDELNVNRDINFRNFVNKHDGLGIRQKLSVNSSVDQQSISPLPPRKYSSNKNQLASDNQVSERFQNLGTGISIRNNALSSDYASQQSSLSNKSSGSSATNHGFSPEKQVNYTNKVRMIDVNTNTHTVGASFVLDRVPTPEPQHRTGPFARLLQYNLSEQPINRLQIQDLAEVDYIPGKIEMNKKTMQSPTIMKRITTPTNTPPSDTITPISTTQNTFQSKSSYNLELIKHNQTHDTLDSMSEQEMMKGFSTEELNQEMANLEGLMKNLSEITQNEFTC